MTTEVVKVREEARLDPAAGSARPAAGYVSKATFQAFADSIEKVIAELLEQERLGWQRRVHDLKRRVAELEKSTA